MNKSSKKLLSAGIVLAALTMSPVVFAAENTSTNKPAAVSEQHAVKPDKNQSRFYKILTIDSIDGQTITGKDKSGKSYTVDASQAKLLGSLNSTSGGLNSLKATDHIIVVGKLTGNNIIAKKIRQFDPKLNQGKKSSKAVWKNQHIGKKTASKQPSSK